MDQFDVAIARFREGYSCAQTVFAALAARSGLDPEVSLRVSAGFGGGIGRTAGLCGCVSGGIMALGLGQEKVDPEGNRAGKEETYAVCRRFLKAFEERNGSTVCSELLGCNIGTPEGAAQAREQNLHHLRCEKYVRDAIELVESMQ